MTDAHCHEPDPGARSLLAAAGPADWPRLVAAEGPVFLGVHPWASAESWSADELESLLEARPDAGVGEIGLDRLRSRLIPVSMRETFLVQLDIAARLGRPVVLHGARCWGETLAACRPFVGRVPAFLFHGFSRSIGLLPDIIAMNGFISVGPALLNDHAVNYREFAKTIPVDRLLVESDRIASRTASEGERTPSVAEIIPILAELRGISAAELEKIIDTNAGQFINSLNNRKG